MKIIIGGAGAVGTHLAELLSNEKQDIILMAQRLKSRKRIRKMLISYIRDALVRKMN